MLLLNESMDGRAGPSRDGFSFESSWSGPSLLFFVLSSDLLGVWLCESTPSVPACKKFCCDFKSYLLRACCLCLFIHSAVVLYVC